MHSKNSSQYVLPSLSNRDCIISPSNTNPYLKELQFIKDCLIVIHLDAMGGNGLIGNVGIFYYYKYSFNINHTRKYLFTDRPFVAMKQAYWVHFSHQLSIETLI